MKISGVMTAALVAMVISGGAAVAKSPTEYMNTTAVQNVARQLAMQGYVIVDVEWTLLGRLKIEAVADGFEREIVVNRFSGEVLRDEWKASASASAVGLDANGDGFLDPTVEVSDDNTAAVAASATGTPDAGEQADSNAESGDTGTAPIAPIQITSPGDSSTSSEQDGGSNDSSGNN